MSSQWGLRISRYKSLILAHFSNFWEESTVSQLQILVGYCHDQLLFWWTANLVALVRFQTEVYLFMSRSFLVSSKCLVTAGIRALYSPQYSLSMFSSFSSSQYYFSSCSSRQYYFSSCSSSQYYQLQFGLQSSQSLVIILGAVNESVTEYQLSSQLQKQLHTRDRFSESFSPSYRYTVNMGRVYIIREVRTCTRSLDVEDMLRLDHQRYDILLNDALNYLITYMYKFCRTTQVFIKYQFAYPFSVRISPSSVGPVYRTQSAVNPGSQPAKSAV